MDWARWRREAVQHLVHQPRTLARDPLAPPPVDIGALVRILHGHGLRWILTGSGALLAAGIRLLPGDLDVVPEPSPENLARLCALLEELEAFPEPAPDWAHGLTVEEVRRWRPSTQITNLNHRFVTAHGVLDVVPDLTGRYDEQVRDATIHTVAGIDVLTADLNPILRRLRASERPKDRGRWTLAAHLLDSRTEQDPTTPSRTEQDSTTP